MIPAGAVKQIDALMGPRGYLHRPEDLTLYEYDGSVDKARPDLVVFARSTSDVVRIVQISNEYKIPIVGRGAGTGLSGGSIPRAGGIVVGFSRMNRIIEIDLANERAVVEPGVVNLDVTLAVQADGYFYAPDPRANGRARSVGTSRKMPAVRTRSPMELPRIMCLGWKLCCRMGQSSKQAGCRRISRDTI